MRIPFKKTYYDETESAAVSDFLLKGTDYLTAVKARLFPDYGNVFLTTSGSSAFDLLFCALDFTKGSEVIMPSFTFPSVANTALRYGLVPVFAEIDRHKKVLDINDVKNKINDRTCCVVTTHYGGCSVDMDEFKAAIGNILLIEDAALSFGGSYKQRPLGTVGDAGGFSFHQTKNVSGGEGGMLILGRALSKSIGHKLQEIYDNGTNKDDYLQGKVAEYTWRQPGMNVAMPPIIAAVLHAQLQKADEILGKQRLIYDYYQRQLGELSKANDFAIPYVPEYNDNNYHVFYLLFEDHEKREYVRERLSNSGIDAFFHYMPLHTSHMGQKLGYAPKDFPVTQSVSSGLLRLPIYASMTQVECAYVVSAIREALGL